LLTLFYCDGSFGCYTVAPPLPRLAIWHLGSGEVGAGSGEACAVPSSTERGCTAGQRGRIRGRGPRSDPPSGGVLSPAGSSPSPAASSPWCATSFNSGIDERVGSAGVPLPFPLFASTSRAPATVTCGATVDPAGLLETQQDLVGGVRCGDPGPSPPSLTAPSPPSPAGGLTW
jgi:hypothetical protein